MYKNRLMCTVIICLFVASHCLAQSLVPIDPGSISDGHVYLLEDTEDSSSNSNTGNLVGAPQVVDGLSGQAMQFNGVDDGVHVPDAATINTSTHQNKTVIAVFNCADVSKSEKQMVFEEGGTTRGLNIYVHEGLAYAGGWNPADYTPQWTGTFLSAPIGSNEWHVVVAVLRGGGAGQENDKFEMWLDGKLIAKGPGAQLNARSDDNAIGHVIGQSKAHDGNIAGGGSFFGGMVDEVWILNTALTENELTAISPNQAKAKSPIPDNAMQDVLRNSPLSWTPGKYAVAHNLYFGNNFEDINSATTPLAVLDVNAYDPGRLGFGKTYFWRVDEVNSAPDRTVFKGDIWNFTAEPYSIQIPGGDIVATASSVSDDLSTPDRTLDGSGLGEDNTHIIQTDSMWFTAMGDMDPWIQYEFDGIKKLDTMKIWNSNSSAEGFIGYGVKGVVIEYSKDGQTWNIFEDVNEFSRASGTPAYNQYDEITLGGIAAKAVRLNIQSNFGGFLQSYSLSEVQFTRIPTAARTPVPASGATGIAPNDMLSWRAGREAVQSTLYLSTDANEVADGLASSVTSNTNGIDLGAFDMTLGKTYYWRVDEVNNAEADSVWAGPVWNFSTMAALVVEDFESYGNDSPDRPFQAWLDGYGYSADEFFPAGYGGNGTGAGIGHDIWTVASPHYNGNIMETTNTLFGSSQSMPFYYTNSGSVASQTERTFAVAQDWTVGGAQTLSIAFAGQTGNTGTLYVKINNTKLTYPHDAANMASGVWQAWNIDLTSMVVQNVTKLQIGVDGSSASGMILIDDIRLHAKAGEVITPVDPGDANMVGAWNFNEGNGTSTADASGNGRTGTIVEATWDAGIQGSALLFGETAYVETGYTGITGTGSRTYTAWIKTVEADRTIMSCGLNTTGNKWRIRLDPTGGLRVEVNGGFHYGQAFLADDEWHHTAVTLADDGTPDVSDTLLYVDGQPETTRAIQSTAMDTDPTGEFRIGMATYDTVGFIGLIDDVRVYDRALSDGEVRSLAGKTTPIEKPF